MYAQHNTTNKLHAIKENINKLYVISFASSLSIDRLLITVNLNWHWPMDNLFLNEIFLLNQSIPFFSA